MQQDYWRVIPGFSIYPLRAEEPAPARPSRLDRCDRQPRWGGGRRISRSKLPLRSDTPQRTHLRTALAPASTYYRLAAHFQVASPTIDLGQCGPLCLGARLNQAPHPPHTANSVLIDGTANGRSGCAPTAIRSGQRAACAASHVMRDHRNLPSGHSTG